MKERESAAVYGTSSEGYRLALFLHSEGDRVHIIDERIKTSYELVGKPPPWIKNLMGEDSLYPIQPLSVSLQEAEKVIIAPRLRYSEEGRAEWLQRLKEIGQNMKKESTIVNLVPMTLGGNKEALAVLEEQSGLKPGSEFTYIYCPAGDSGVVASTSQAVPDWLGRAMNSPVVSSNLDEAEMLYARWALSSYTPKALDASFYRETSSNMKFQTLFLDDLALGIYEMHLFADTLQHGDTLHHFATGSLKAVSSYIHTLESYLRSYSRNRGLKAIRSKVLIVWGFDTQEMKSERSRILSGFLNSLREIFGEVDFWNSLDQSEEKRRIPAVEKYQMIVACSRNDLDVCRTSMRRNSGQALISASIPIQEF